MTFRLPDFLTTLDFDKTALRFLGILGFSLSFSPALVSISLGFILLLFLLERRYKARLALVAGQPLSYIALALVALHILGFLWTSDTDMAGQTFSRGWKFLLIPFFMMYVRRENVPFLLAAFLLGMVLSELTSYLLWLGVIAPFGKATDAIPSPFMSYPYYTIYASLTAALLVHFLLFDRPKDRWRLLAVIGFLVAVLVNLSITGGRGGQVGFFVLLFVLLMMYFGRRWLNGVVTFVLASALLFYSAYQFIPVFQERADLAIEEVMHFEEGGQNSSVGIRIALNINYFNAFLEAPLFGHGTGSYLDAYARANERSAYQTHITQPHNMYLVMLVQFGLLGGTLFMAMFGYMLWQGWHSTDALRAFRVAFPIFWLTVMWVNWYLYSHHTFYAFLFLTSILYTPGPSKENHAT
ncbi:O-antigen ligase family protein [Sedimenticola selenatireducens]|uniref:O-antigen ligase family protein n=1 Tax=Sedimenticola selenatireducens TaxID=191960 RepID=UPI002AABFC5B|nr:O-antigen ligase family protein [Sedimenticola selenatireducens]